LVFFISLLILGRKIFVNQWRVKDRKGFLKNFLKKKPSANNGGGFLSASSSLHC